jgi:hypothetical protein
MCGAIVSGLHSISMDVLRDCSRFAQPQSNRDRLRRSLLQVHHAVGDAARGDFTRPKDGRIYTKLF